MSLPLVSSVLLEYPSLSSACAQFGLDGLEVIWGGEAFPETPSCLPIGYHLAFYPDWLDFWREDTAALNRKFGAPEVWKGFYGGDRRERLLEFYRADLDRAASLGAEYVVFHVSDISIEEGYTYQFLHTNEEVIEGALEVIKLLLHGCQYPFAFFVENQWWPGFTFTDPALTARLLDAIPWQDKGIMLDTGHLMNCNLSLKSEAEGCAYLHQMLDAHGSLCKAVRGIHLHQSLSGAYVKTHTGPLPPLPRDYYERYSTSYRHILNIDQHKPFTSPAAAGVVARIAPDYLVHELSAADRSARDQAIQLQSSALRPLFSSPGA